MSQAPLSHPEPRGRGRRRRHREIRLAAQRRRGMAGRDTRRLDETDRIRFSTARPVNTDHTNMSVL